MVYWLLLVGVKSIEYTFQGFFFSEWAMRDGFLGEEIGSEHLLLYSTMDVNGNKTISLHFLPSVLASPRSLSAMSLLWSRSTMCVAFHSISFAYPYHQKRIFSQSQWG